MQIEHSSPGFFCPGVEIEDYNVMIQRKKIFFNQPVNNKTITYNNIWKIANGRGDDYMIDCLQDYHYGKDHYKTITIDLSKQQALLGVNQKAIKQINFTEKLKENIIIFFILEETKEIVLYFSQTTMRLFWFYYILM